MWLFDLHQPEGAFWHGMNPARLLALLHARQRPRQDVPTADTQPQSLFAYLTGGG